MNARCSKLAMTFLCAILTVLQVVACDHQEKAPH